MRHIEPRSTNPCWNLALEEYAFDRLAADGGLFMLWRNDMTIGRKKFSGNSQYRKNGYIMHHGTLLYDSDLPAVAAVLRPDAEKLSHKGLKSVRSRGDEYPPLQPTVGFMALLRKKMTAALGLTDYGLTETDCNRIETLVAQRYANWDWNYGSSPAHNMFVRPGLRRWAR